MKTAPLLLAISFGFFATPLFARDNGGDTGVFSGQPEPQEWTKKDGSVVEGHVKGYDFDSKQVLIQGTDGTSIAVPAEDLSAASKLQMLDTEGFWKDHENEEWPQQGLQQLGIYLAIVFLGGLILKTITLWLSALIAAQPRGRSILRAFLCLLWTFLGMLVVVFVYAAITIAMVAGSDPDSELGANMTRYGSLGMIVLALLVFLWTLSHMYRIGIGRTLVLFVVYVIVTAGVNFGIGYALQEYVNPDLGDQVLSEYILKPLGIL